MPHLHQDANNLAGRRLALSLALTLAFVIGELLAGIWSHSIALMSDAGHNLADALALLLSWYGVRAALWPSSAARTFGYHRVGVLAALANAASLVLIAGFIIWGAAQRLMNPQPVAGPAMIWVAAVAIVLNSLIALWLHRSAKNDLNIRSAYIHMLGDAFAAVGVVIAGVIVTLSGKPIADPICSLIIGGLILWTSWGILTESVNVLLEGTPAGVDMASVEKMIAAVPGVLGVHDLHVWSLGSGVVACSCHILVGEQSIREGQQVLRAVTDELDHHFHITHTTVQVEVEGCDPDDMYCTLKHSAGHEHGHSHSHAHHGHHAH
ncbi:MAG TPA: cation diffusion facilitator family transporter [Humisphaera sp.]|jgi:cobalt-zinc-cadmium efflux system protein|nr:cation diffusion facilitator family transporter [Humisphaera sp.]